jgi:PKD repeat protein
MATSQLAEPGDFTVTIDWGNNTSPTSGTLVQQSSSQMSASSQFAVDGTHTFVTPGTYTVTITITDVGGSHTQTTTTITVADARPADGGNAPDLEVPIFDDPRVVGVLVENLPDADEEQVRLDDGDANPETASEPPLTETADAWPEAGGQSGNTLEPASRTAADPEEAPRSQWVAGPDEDEDALVPASIALLPAVGTEPADEGFLQLAGSRDDLHGGTLLAEPASAGPQTDDGLLAAMLDLLNQLVGAI